jgi:hypothetical protein
LVLLWRKIGFRQERWHAQDHRARDRVRIRTWACFDPESGVFHHISCLLEGYWPSGTEHFTRRSIMLFFCMSKLCTSPPPVFCKHCPPPLALGFEFRDSRLLGRRSYCLSYFTSPFFVKGFLR